MKGSPRVSVLLPVHNGGAHLVHAATSILDQTLQDLELIVIDDGSTDGATRQLPDDPRIHLLRSPHRGIVTALNSGGSVVRAPILARMDADDISLPTRLQQQVDLLEQDRNLGIVGACVEIFRDDGPVGDGYKHYQDWVNGLREPEEIAREIFVESPIPHPTAMLRLEVFRTLGGYRKVPWPEDYDLWLRAWETGIAMAKPTDVLLRWRDHDKRLSRQDNRYSLASFMRARAQSITRTLLKDREALIWGAAPTGAMLFDSLMETGARVRAFIDIDPRKIGGNKRGRPVLSPEAADDTGGALILGAVGSRGARARIRTSLLSMGKQEGRDFVLLA